MDSKTILAKAKEYRDYTARNLGEMVKVPGFSTTEKNRVLLLKKLCEEAGMEDLRIDGLGSLLGRVGKGSKKLVFDAHIDTVGVGDPAQWKTPPHSGMVKDGSSTARLHRSTAAPAPMIRPPVSEAMAYAVTIA